MKKIIISVILALALLLPCLASCSSIGGSGDGSTADGTSDGPSDNNNNGSGGGNTPALPVGNPSSIGEEADESSTLPTISIITDSGKMITTKEYMTANVSASGSTLPECNFEKLAAQVKCRGNHTFQSTEKKSYRVKFDEKINLFNQGRGEAKSWVLMAEHCDQSFLRNHIAMTLATRLDKIAYSASSSFVHLYVNGKYQGIYRLTEQHQVQENRVVINEDPDVVDTDYFVEWDAYASEDGNVKGLNYFTCDGNMFLVKSDYMTEEKCEFLDNYFTEAYEAIKSGVQKDVVKYIDVDSFVDMYILQEFAKNIDVGWSSFFMVKKAGGKISCTCPWDFDLSFGNDGRLDEGGFENLYVGNSEYAFGWNSLDQGNEWFCYLMRSKWFVNKVITRWNQVKGDMLELAVNEATRIYTCFGDEIEKNFTVWKIFGQKINQEPRHIRAMTTYSEHAEYFIQWIKDRHEWMSEYFSDPSTKYKTTEYTEPTWRPW